MKIGFYHHGSAPAAEVAKAIAEKRMAYCGRNANDFVPADVEKDFTEVVVDKGPKSEVIREVYEARNIPVLTVDEFLDQEPKTEAPANDALDPDKPRAKPRGKKQGEPKTEAPANEVPA